jgi:hypothetical protein
MTSNAAQCSRIVGRKSRFTLAKNYEPRTWKAWAVIQCSKRPPSRLANGGQEGLVSWGRSSNELGSRIDVGAAKAMPADKYSFAPTQGIFAAGQTTQFDTVRTFAAQVTHLAQANYFFFGWSGIKPDRDLKAIGSITTKDEAVAALEASFVYAQGDCDHHDRKCICRHQAGRRVQHAGYDCRFCSGPRE